MSLYSLIRKGMIYTIQDTEVLSVREVQLSENISKYFSAICSK